MDAPVGGHHLEEGARALEEARWDAARIAFEAALDTEETPHALDGIGLALWFLGNVKEGTAARERAFESYLRSGRCDDAARTAVWVSHQHLIAGRASAARGWLSRAERAVEGVGPCVGQGWVAVERARHAGSVEECAEHARRAMAIARDAQAGDLEVFALSLLGRAEVNLGRKEHGMQLLEEAMAAASAGRIRNVHTLAEAYCNLVMACTSAGEWQRATEWCEMVDEFAHDHGAIPLLGACRTVHADVLMATGRWGDAERALGARSRHTPATCLRWVRRRSPRWRSFVFARGACWRPSNCSRAARSTRDRCGRSHSFASPRTSRRWRPRCLSAGCRPRRAMWFGRCSCLRRWSTLVWPVGRPGPRKRLRRNSRSSRAARASS